MPKNEVIVYVLAREYNGEMVYFQGFTCGNYKINTIILEEARVYTDKWTVLFDHKIYLSEYTIMEISCNDLKERKIKYE